REQMADPGCAHLPVVVGRRNAQRLSPRGIPVQSLYDVWHAVLVGLVERRHTLAQLATVLQRTDTVTAPAPTHMHADDVDNGHWALHHRGQLVADRHVLPPCRRRAAPRLGVVRHVDLSKLLGGPVLALDMRILARLLRALTFGVDVRLVASCDRNSV